MGKCPLCGKDTLVGHFNTTHLRVGDEFSYQSNEYFWQGSHTATNVLTGEEKYFPRPTCIYLTPTILRKHG